MFPPPARQVFPTENRALAMGTCSTMARVGSLITPFVSQVCRRLSCINSYYALSLPGSSVLSVLVLGIAEHIGTSDPVRLRCLLSAGHRCVLSAAL